MAANNIITKSYSAAAQGPRQPTQDQASQAQPQGAQSSNAGPATEARNAGRSPSPSHIPKTAAPEDNVYVLTILTDKAHHARMTRLREKYFPKHLNKLAAHLTLFHALPGSALESKILPFLEAVASGTAPFKVHAAKAFRLKKGIAISVPPQSGGEAGQQVHSKLRDHWKQDGFLSDQDAGGCRLHYTVMNKVDDEATIASAFDEINRTWNGDTGTAEGLALYKYDRGHWRWQRNFSFVTS